ncbi:MAG: hypothetical protein K6E10_01000 [Eubacterium sp.]|nr:hypothetical protein [Eubacterium sp.]
MKNNTENNNNQNNNKNKIIALTILLIGILMICILYFLGNHDFNTRNTYNQSKTPKQEEHVNSDASKKIASQTDTEKTDTANNTVSKTDSSSDQKYKDNNQSKDSHPSDTKQVGWVVYGGDRYYYDKNGKPVSGSVKLNDKYFIFNNSGKLIKEDKLISQIKAIPQSGQPIITSDYSGAQHKANEEANYNYADRSKVAANTNSISQNNSNTETTKESNNISTDKESDSNNEADAESDKEYIHDTLVGIGGYTPTDKDNLMINNRINELSGYNVGFSMINLYTGKGIAYNVDNSEYSASCIKGIYVASLVSENPDTLKSRFNTMQEVVSNSDNDGYNSLRGSYGRAPLVKWCEELELDSQVSYHYYPFISARELAILWIHTYFFLNTDENGMQIKDIYTSPIYDSIYTVLGNYGTENDTVNYSMSLSNTIGKGYRTESKAGWISSPHYCSTTDGGIIYPPEGDPYIITICTDLPADLMSLEPLCSTLDTIYQNTCD